MIGLIGLLVFGFSALCLMAALMSDSPSEADSAARVAFVGVLCGLAMMVGQLGVWLWRWL